MSLSLFRNPYVKRMAISMLCITGGCTSIGFYWGIASGIVTLSSCLLLAATALFSAHARYREIAILSQEIDNILHSTSPIVMENYAEGELSILRTEIYKMTVRLRTQADLLEKDKRYLADAIADISHQIKTPLTSISLMLSLLQTPDIDLQKRQTLCRDCSRLISRMDWLVSALLKMSKIDAGTAVFQKEPVCVEKLISLSLEPLLIPIELSNQKLKVYIAPFTSFTGDLAWSVEAIGNFLKNAMEHTPNGGEISIYGEENAIYTEIRICDSGTGIPEEDLPHIFERFYRGKHMKDGSFGIGLALSKMIITAQNGTVKAYNRKEQGACFQIRIYKTIV